MWAPPPPNLAPWRVLAPLASMDLSRVASTSARPQLPARDFRRQFEIQRALLGASDVRSILAVVRSKVDGDNGLGAMSFVHVATSLNRMGKVVWRADSGARDSERNLGDDPDFLALLRRAREFTYAGSKMSQAWANSVHALAKLRELRRRLRVEPGDEVWDTWLDLIRRYRISKASSSRSTSPACGGRTPSWASSTTPPARRSAASSRDSPTTSSPATSPTRYGRSRRWESNPRAWNGPYSTISSRARSTSRRTFPSSVDASSLRTSPTRSGRLQKSADFPRRTRRALDAAVRRHARAMRSQEIANSVYALGVLGHSPGADAEAALAGAARGALRVESRKGESPPSLTRNLSPTCCTASPPWARGLTRRRGRRGRRGGETRAANVHAGRVHNPVGARYRAQTAGRGSFLALERRYAQLSSRPETVEKQNHSVVLWAYGKLNTTPSDDMWNALESVAGEKTVEYERHDVFMALWGYAALGRYPRSRRVAEQLEAAALRAVDEFLPDEINNVLWSCALLRAVRGVPLPAFYARLWARMTKMPASAFQSDEVIRVGYHAHFVHARLLRDEDPVPDLEPSFERRAEELWFAQKKKVRVSAMQLEVGEALKRLGVAHVAEPPPFPR